MTVKGQGKQRLSQSNAEEKSWQGEMFIGKRETRAARHEVDNEPRPQAEKESFSY